MKKLIIFLILLFSIGCAKKVVPTVPTLQIYTIEGKEQITEYFETEFKRS